MDAETRKSISTRLKQSSPKFWSTLSEQTQSAIVQKFYDLQGIGSVGIRSVLQDNANVRRNLATLYLGVLFGILGNLVADVLVKYLPNDWRLDVAIGVGFILFSLWLIREFNNVLSKHLAADRVLEHLFAIVKKETADSQS